MHNFRSFTNSKLSQLSLSEVEQLTNYVATLFVDASARISDVVVVRDALKVVGDAMPLVLPHQLVSCTQSESS